MFQTRGQTSQTQQAAMRTYTKAGLVGLALLSSAEVRDSGTQSPMSPRLRVRKTPEGWSPRPHAPPVAVPPGSPTQRACGGGNHSHRCAGIEPGPATLMRNSLHVVARACCERPGRGEGASRMRCFGFLRGACPRRDADSCLVCRPFLSDRQRFPSTGVPVSWHARQRPLCAQPRSD